MGPLGHARPPAIVGSEGRPRRIPAAGPGGRARGRTAAPPTPGAQGPHGAASFPAIVGSEGRPRRIPAPGAQGPLDAA